MRFLTGDAVCTHQTKSSKVIQKSPRSYQTYQRVGYGVVWILVPVPEPLYFNKVVSDTRVFCRGRTELTKVLGYGWVWMSELTKGSGTGLSTAVQLVLHGCTCV